MVYPLQKFVSDQLILNFLTWSCSCSVELRELESMLKAGYMNKERAAQMAEREAHKYDEMVRDSEIAKLMKEEHERAEAVKKERERERYQEHVRYQQELERQLEVSTQYRTRLEYT